MNKVYTLGTTVLVSVLLIACGTTEDTTSSGSSDQSYTSGAVVEINTVAEAENAAAAIGNLNSSVNQVSTPSPSPSRSPSLSSVNGTQSCSGGGSIVTTGNADDTTADFTTSYDNCNQSGITLTGSSTTIGTNNGGLVKLKITTNDLKYQFSDSDFYNMNLILDLETSDSYAANIIYNGIINYSMTEIGSGKMAYDNFHILVNQSQELDLEGKVSVAADQNTCQNGVYNIETLKVLTPTSNGYSSGTMVVNGATYVYNNDGTADVTFIDGSTRTITQGASIICN